IQALDLVGRKLGRDGGRAIGAFFAEVGAFAKTNAGDAAMQPYAAPLATALQHLQQATMWLMQNAMQKPDNAGAASTDYLHLFGLVALGFMWGRMARIAQDKVAAGDATALHEAKLVTARYYFERIMPESAAHLARISVGCDAMMALAEDAF